MNDTLSQFFENAPTSRPLSLQTVLQRRRHACIARFRPRSTADTAPRLGMGVLLHHFGHGVEHHLILPSKALFGAARASHAQLFDCDGLVSFRPLSAMLSALKVKAEAVVRAVAAAYVQ